MAMGLGQLTKRSFSLSTQRNLRDVVIASAARTPMGSFRGPMAAVPAPKLGAITIEESLKRANVEKEAIDEVYMGNVLPGGMMDGCACRRLPRKYSWWPPLLINQPLRPGSAAPQTSAWQPRSRSTSCA
eukprot:01567.XXX_1315_2256_1 [CDS] Oithona nana genome sequencing.